MTADVDHDQVPGKALEISTKSAPPAIMPPEMPCFPLFQQLPFELRLVIWEMAVFDLPSRVCCLVQSFGERPMWRAVEQEPPERPIVYDIPSLRYVCQESRQVALRHSAAAGWMVCGSSQPYRQYHPLVDALYLRDFKYLGISAVAIHRELNGVASTAATWMRQVRHIVLPLSICKVMAHQGYKTLQLLPTPVISHAVFAKCPFIVHILRAFPRVQTISVAIGCMDMPDSLAGLNTCSSCRLPWLPCKLDYIEDLDSSSAWLMRTGTLDKTVQKPDAMKQFCRNVKGIIAEFAKKADFVADLAGTPRVPSPNVATMSQLVKSNEKGYEWEGLQEHRGCN